MLIDIRKAGSRGFKLGTSVILGFPSETDEEFQGTLKFCNEVGFDWIYCHNFSARPGTRAADLPDQLPNEVVQERMNHFQAGIYKKGAVIFDF